MTHTARATFVRTLLLSALLAWPFLPNVPYDFLNTAIIASEYCIVALSLVLLVGLVGQISLCQAALVGMGAFVAALMTNKLSMRFPATLVFGLLAGAVAAAVIGVVALRVRGLYLAVATLIFGYLCDQYLFAQDWLVQSRSGTSIPLESIGQPGTIPSFDLADAHVFYFVALAIAVLTLYAVANLRDSRIGRAFAAVRGSEVAAASLGINVVRTKLIGFACAGALAGLGGAITLAGSRSVAPDQFNFVNSLYFLAIAVVGGLRSIGGAVASAALFAVLVGEVFFRSPTLADYRDIISAILLIAVLLFFRGGLGAVPERLPQLFARLRSRAAPLLVPLRPVRLGTMTDAAAPHFVLMTKLGRSVRRVGNRVQQASRPMRELVGRAVQLLLPRRRASSETMVQTAAEQVGGPVDVIGLVHELSGSKTLRTDPSTLKAEHFGEIVELDSQAGSPDEAVVGVARPTLVRERVAGHPGPGGRRLPVLLSAKNITVRFGGLTAVNDASLQVGAGEIIGLIGPNGAGKTTMFNSILGLNTPSGGHVTLFDREVTSWEVHRRAALGVGRTFQILQLFGDLTVFDNLLVATHLGIATGLWGGLVVSRRARQADDRARDRVHAVLRLMELDHVADRRVAGLPFGVLRLIEIARTLVTGARLVCFDEPASGLDSTETERLLEWFRFLRRIGITLLVIEHDVSFVVRLCDYIYVLDQGRLLAHGTPSQIQRDPAVVASYLGAPIEVA